MHVHTEIRPNVWWSELTGHSSLSAASRRHFSVVETATCRQSHPRSRQCRLAWFETSCLPHLLRNRITDGGEIVSLRRLTSCPPLLKVGFLVLVSVRSWLTEARHCGWKEQVSWKFHLAHRGFNQRPYGCNIALQLTALIQSEMFFFSNKMSTYIRCEGFTAVAMKNGVFWDVTLCCICKNRHFGGA
jgi:hypothetical protein